ncbi:MAG TPA: hypothetical protein H9774_10980 [Candidatus Desulfovibrio gallistercoris]|nr:hypothetical protein [Candidatus Desulfovibrio gallistercoris]
MKRFAFQTIRPGVRGKRGLPLTFGRVALCCRLAFYFSKDKMLYAPAAVLSRGEEGSISLPGRGDRVIHAWHVEIFSVAAGRGNGWRHGGRGHGCPRLVGKKDRKQNGQVMRSAGRSFFVGGGSQIRQEDTLPAYLPAAGQGEKRALKKAGTVKAAGGKFCVFLDADVSCPWG